MAQYIDLYSKLSEEDKETIKNYIYTFGVKEEDFLGLEEWLQNWSHSNQKLYKLLGNQFIYKTDFSYIKELSEIREEISQLINTNHFTHEYDNFIDNLFSKRKEDKIIIIKDGKMLNYDIGIFKSIFSSILSSYIFTTDMVPSTIKIKREDKRKTLQIQEGTKPIRALSKIVEYFKDIYDFSSFEDFRIKHSIIFNDKEVKGKLCLSIHPLDFMTMSDNASDWCSCMSWADKGCYYIGTVEMMNSNNVICCYIEREAPYIFNENIKTNNSWNNKKWRQLVYLNKDIIVCGKSYPFLNSEISKELISIVKDLAEKNLSWHYKYGPELYNDMKYYFECYSMNRARNFIRTKNYKKHNIIFDTMGMYNDMMNDKEFPYWCFRNKVKHTKIYSISGKSPCLCCGESVLNLFEYDDIYNDRFSNTGSLICDDCREHFVCDNCKCSDPFEKLYEVEGKKYCRECIERDLRICPDCGKIFCMWDTYNTCLYDPYNTRDKEIISNFNEFAYSSEEQDKRNLQRVYWCPHCDLKHNGEYRIVKDRFGKELRIYDHEKFGIPSKYFKKNLKKIPINF